ncbi:hypothetical protein HPB50_029103 [Hyalomma asiaticum]|nr:hypothetical protein HPB50_029103 [Hyalomma asiaticum]
MVRDHSTHREAAAKDRRRRSRRRHSSEKSAAPPSHLPHPPSSPLPLPPRPSTAEKSLTEKVDEKTVAAKARPAVQNQPPPREPQRTVYNQSHASAFGNVPVVDRQVTVLVQTLITTIRELISKMKPQAARSALQILETRVPVLASIV